MAVHYGAKALSSSWPHVHQLTVLQAKRLDAGACELRQKRLAVSQPELNAHFEPQEGESLDGRRAQRPAVGLQQDLQVVRAHEPGVEAAHSTNERHDKSVGGLVINLTRRASLL